MERASLFSQAVTITMANGPMENITVTEFTIGATARNSTTAVQSLPFKITHYLCFKELL
jgi:hypothetical protein